MSLPYSIYLGGRHLSDHATFTEAADAYRRCPHRNGINMRNGERSDVDDNGMTEEETETLDAFESALTSLAHAVFCDSGATGIKYALRQALATDVAAGAALPDNKTITLFVCGDEEGKVPECLAKTYVNVNTLLVELCQ